MLAHKASGMRRLALMAAVAAAVLLLNAAPLLAAGTDWGTAVKEARTMEGSLAQVEGFSEVHVVPLPGYGIVAMYSTGGALDPANVERERQATYFTVMGDTLLTAPFLTNQQNIVTAVDFSGNELIRVAPVEKWTRFLVGWKGGWSGKGNLPRTLPAGITLPGTPIPNLQKLPQEERDRQMADAALLYRNGRTLDGLKGLSVEAWARGRHDQKVLADLIGRAYNTQARAAHIPNAGLVFSYTDPGGTFAESMERVSVIIELLSTTQGVGDNEFLAVYARTGADQAMLCIAPAGVIRKSRMATLTTQERQQITWLWGQ